MSLVTALAGLLVIGGLAGAAVSLYLRDRRQVSDLRQVLEMRYLDADDAIGVAEAGSLLTRTGVVAERALAGTSVLGRLRGLVERSDWKLTPGEVVAVSAFAAVLGVVLGLLGGSPVLAVLLAVIGGAGPYVAVTLSVTRRTSRFQQQFPGILDLISASLESGAGIPQALELVVAEADEPAASEFARVLSATRLGAPLTEALQEMAVRLGSRDLSWTVQAIAVQQRTGGRLAEVLRIVAGVMRSREEIRRELAALTAEGKLSAYILGGLPVFFALFLSVAQPDYLRPLYTTGLGIALLVTATVLVAVSFLVMLRIIKIEV